jgi:hypothetical protein
LRKRWMMPSPKFWVLLSMLWPCNRPLRGSLVML